MALRVLLGVTLLLGVLGAVGLAAGAPDDATFVLVSQAVQMLMSVTLPFTGVLLARAAVRLPEMWLRATFLAVAVGGFGVVLAVVAVLATSGDWDDAVLVAVGGVLVQVVAQFVGTGFGLLLPRRPVIAGLATIVLPLGLYLLLGLAPALRPVREWVTPYATVLHLLSGEMTALSWVRWAVVAVVWAVGLNAWGAARRNRRNESGPGGT
ncbi:hypothetical protein [Actinoplanes sp. NPDC049265]|uniref:hypothetical protein n=1 Tax=Actinoplanes sp. NPDC049265 TaxID=3363902 RepID=UPI003721F80A